MWRGCATALLSALRASRGTRAARIPPTSAAGTRAPNSAPRRTAPVAPAQHPRTYATCTPLRAAPATPTHCVRARPVQPTPSPLGSHAVEAAVGAHPSSRRVIAIARCAAKQHQRTARERARYVYLACACGAPTPGEVRRAHHDGMWRGVVFMSAPRSDGACTRCKHSAVEVPPRSTSLSSRRGEAEENFKVHARSRWKRAPQGGQPVAHLPTPPLLYAALGRGTPLACACRIMAASCPGTGKAHSPARSRRQGAVKLSSSACGKHPTHTHAPRCTHHARRGCRPRHPGMCMCARAVCPRRKYLRASCSEAFPSGPLQIYKGKKGGYAETGCAITRSAVA